MNIVYLISRKWSADILQKLIKEKKSLNIKLKIFTTQKKFIDQNLLNNIQVTCIKEKELKKYAKPIKKFDPKNSFQRCFSHG